ncbi:hypothetical protein MKO06_16730 [Gramella sp. GC03-9]|uniref:Lipoprotein n=1 Tax=Christiangramia oceanisediminis TaxID=2920386 RepID=A0A9X2L051_9FLAO|nr:hypothetical protein [Gramella oceanisediminis]MCP9201558.1 hypothetical protein [Gramella oceanisediminis]
MFRLKLIIVPTLIISCLSLTSCFKDVDFGQAPDIALEPDLQVDLAYYELNETDFFDSETNLYTPLIRDTLRLEFLDDDYIQDGLMFVEFRFRHENRFPFPVRSNIKFLNENNRREFSIAYTIPEGSTAMPSVVDTLKVMEGNDIRNVRRSIQMVMELDILGGGQELEGSLDFSSKGLFRFEF